MSLTRPIPSPDAAQDRSSGAPRRGRLAARVESLATPRNGVLLLLGAAALAVAVFFVRPTYPNYDIYYSLIWGDELASGRLPDYNVFRTPTPHPLTTLVGAALSPLGGAADRVAVLLSLLCFLALLALMFRFTQLLLGTLVAAVAVLVLLTRTDIEYFAFRAVVDPWFLACIFAAAVLELQKPRRGWPVLALLSVAGLLRPEAWVFAGLYWLWLVPKLGRRAFVLLGLLAISAPLLWLAADFIVTGKPLYSLTSTREVAGQFDRQRSVPEALRLLPAFIGGPEKVLTVVIGGLGSVLTLYILRRRAALPLAMMGIGIGVFLAISAVGLSVIKRYLILPSLLLSLGVAVGFAGWLVVRDPRARRVAMALAGLALLVLVWRTPSYVKDFQRLNAQTYVIRDQHQQLKQVLGDPDVVNLLRTCRGPITVPTHSSIPVIRYETGLGKGRIQAALQQRRPPDEGLLVVARSFFFESTKPLPVGAIPASIPQWWANHPLQGFRPVAGNNRWRVYARC